MRNCFLIFLVLIFLVGCGKDANSPEAITTKFVELMTNGDKTGAAKLGTEPTSRYLDFRETSMEMLGENDEAIDVTSVKCFVEDGQANCLMCCDPNGEKQNITLVKVNNKWLVDINVDALIKDLEDAMSDLDEAQKEEEIK